MNKEFKLNDICLTDWYFPIKGGNGSKVVVKNVVCPFKPLEEHQNDDKAINHALQNMRKNNKTTYGILLRDENKRIVIADIIYKKSTGNQAYKSN